MAGVAIKIATRPRSTAWSRGEQRGCRQHVQGRAESGHGPIAALIASTAPVRYGYLAGPRRTCTVVPAQQGGGERDRAGGEPRVQAQGKDDRAAKYAHMVEGGTKPHAWPPAWT